VGTVAKVELRLDLFGIGTSPEAAAAARSAIANIRACGW